MEIREMQQEVDRWISQFEEGYWHPLAMLARLTEEVGELAREVNHLYGQKPKNPGNPREIWPWNWPTCFLLSPVMPTPWALTWKRPFAA